MKKRQSIKDALAASKHILLIGEEGWYQEDAIAAIAKEMDFEFISAYACVHTTWYYFYEPTSAPWYPNWAIEAHCNPDKQYILYLDHVQECLDAEYENLRGFVETGRIGEYILENVRVCAVYNVYDAPAKKNLNDFDFLL
ncbi:MAG: hypothetical protein IKV05_06080 [Bacteroidales bacterium]|nr:hypothetical protein [Bacteroidales bacterium]